MRKRRRIRFMLLLGVAVFTTALGLFAYHEDWFHRNELDSVDMRFSIRGDTKHPSNIVVVGVDDVTFDETHQQWPFPRKLHAKVIDRLKKDGAKVIGFDVQFTEPTDDANDGALFDAAGNAGNLVFATTETDSKGHTAILGGDENLKSINASPGQGLLPDDPGGVKRRLAYQIEKLKLFSVVVAERYLGHPVDKSKFK
jgi:CHASE2 domain-containing sensor protein